MMTEQQYQAAMARCSMLVALDPHPDSLAGTELERISLAIEEYEKAHFPFPQPTPAQMLAFRREQEGHDDGTTVQGGNPGREQRG